MSSPADLASTPADLTAVPSAPLSRRVLALLADLVILALVAAISIWQLGLRLLEGIGAIPPNQANNAALMPSGLLNAMLYKVGSAEATLARVLGLPFGSSIVLVAVKP